MRRMKDSGIEWIGEIPEEWEIVPLRYIVHFGKGLPITKADLIEKGDAVISYGQIHSKSNCGYNLSAELLRFVDPVFQETNPDSLVNKDDFIFADTSEDHAGIGNCVYVNDDLGGNLFAGYHTVIASPNGYACPQYLAFLFLTDAWRSQLRSQASGIKVYSITQKMLKTTMVLAPEEETRLQIVDYLDRKCAEIDAVIARQEAVIEKLKKYKLSLITEAVTRGLNPDAPMKDSGVEWIGQIPEHWKTMPIKNGTDILPGYAFSSMDFDTEIGIPLLRGINVTPNGIRWQDVVYWNKEITDQLSIYKLLEGDIVVGLDRPWISEGMRVCWVTKEDVPSLLLQRVCRIRTDETFDSRWIFHWISSKAFMESLSCETTGVSVPHISTKQIGQFIITLPPEEDMKNICDFLSRKCAAVNESVRKKQALIDRLTSYKKSLIYEVVTGKREVSA